MINNLLEKNNRSISPLIAVSVDDSLTIRDLNLIKKYNADIIEIRIDLFKKNDVIFIKDYILKIKKITNKAVLATIRNVEEGGKNNFPFNEKLFIFKNIIPLIDYIDVELNSKKLLSIIPYAKKNNVKVILSYHNFQLTPNLAALNKIALKFLKTSADILKIAVMPKSSIDVKRLLEFTLNQTNISIVTIAMGNIGKLSRVFFASAGSCITYCSIKGEKAPGQINLKKIREYINNFY